MTSKIHLNKLIQISNNEEAALANINANVDILNDVIDDYVSRSAKVPTQMQAPLDMGSQKIINVGTPTDDNDVVRYKDVKDALATIEQVQIDIQDVDNAVIRANNAATSANQSAVDAYNSKETAVSAKIDAQAADEHITELLTEDYPEITTVANNISDVQTVAGVAGDVTTVAGVATEVSTLGGIASDVTAVAGVTSDVTTVAGIASDVTTVAGVSTAVQDIEDNLAAVQGAAQNASDAADSAELAHKWATSSTVVESGQYGASYYALRAANYENGAETARDTARDWATKTDGTVADNEYSAKYYAEQAASTLSSLGTAAYTDATDYATAAQGTKADTALQNTATGTNSLTVLGTATSSNYSTNIGVSSAATSSYETVVGYNASAASSESVAIGCGTKVNSSSKGAIAIGPYAQATGAGAIQIGYGHNQTAKSLSIGFFDSVNPVKYTLLNEFGEVPEGRLTQLMISDDSDPTTATVGTVGLLYKNTTDGGIFKCTDTTGGTYVWEEIGAGTTTLSGLTDVTLSTPTDGQALVYNSVTQKWENADVSSGASSLEDIAVAGEGITFINAPFINATVVGSPTISSSYVASGFSDSDYLTHSNLLNNVTDSFEIVVPFYTNTTSTNNFGLIDSLTPCNVRLTLTSDAKVRLRISTDGTTNYAIDMTGTTTLTMHAKYWVKVFYERSIGYRLLLSTNGSDWNLENHTVTTTKPYSSGNILKIGDNAATGYSLDGGIYLAGTYIQVDDKIWNAVEETRTGIEANIDTTSFLKNTATDSNSITILGTPATQGDAINIGQNTSAAVTSTAIGNGSKASGASAVAIGSGNDALSRRAIAIGYNNDVSSSAESGIAIGTYAVAQGNYGIAIGAGDSVYSQVYAVTNSIAIGRLSTASYQNNIAIGYGSNASGNGYAIQLGYGTNSTANTFSVGLSVSNNYRLLNSDGTIPFARQAKAIIEGASDPDTATVGTVGLLYRNTTDGGIFKCTDITGGVYTWEELGAGGSSASYDPVTKTITL